MGGVQLAAHLAQSRFDLRPFHANKRTHRGDTEFPADPRNGAANRAARPPSGYARLVTWIGLA